jgi:hypothetical protein
MSKGFNCECGKYHQFSVYVFAHTHVELTHTCDCGRKHMIFNLEVIDGETNEQDHKVRGRRKKRNSAGR